MLRKSGSQVWHVGFSADDLAFWFHQRRYTPFCGKSDKWAQAFTDLNEEKDVTDIVLYGDTRPIVAWAFMFYKRAICAHSGSPLSGAAPTEIRALWVLQSPRCKMPFPSPTWKRLCPLHAGAICAITYFTERYIIGSLCFGMATIAISASISA